MLERPETILRVLRIIDEHGGRLDVRTLAQHLWPHSPLWKRPARRPNSSGHRELGVRLHTAAGCFCGRLVARGLLCRVAPGTYELTDSGRRHLAPAAPALAAAAVPAAAPAWRQGWVYWPDGRWYAALVGLAYGPGVIVAFSDGRSFIMPASCVA